MTEQPRAGDDAGPEQETEQVAVDLPTDATAPSAARRAAGTVLRGWRLDGLLDAVLLTVSELVTNAVRYGRPPLTLVLRRSPLALRVDVHDEAPERPPVLRPAPDDAENGRGLLIVDALADDEGVEQVAGDGKTVWASFRTDGTGAARD